MEKEILKPKRRFKGFTGDWEQRNFVNLFICLQNNSLSRADLNYKNGVIKNIHYGDVLIKFGEMLNVEVTSIPFVSNPDFVIRDSAILQNGDIIIADAAEDETVGKCTEITGLNDVLLVSGLHTIPCRPIEKFAFGYMGYYMNSNAYHNRLLPLIQGTKISSISKSALRETSIIFPESHEEQKQLGSFFAQLDNLITLQQHKMAKLKLIKKAYLSEMFPADGECNPKRRFEGFTDNWEVCQLGEFAEIKTGSSDLQDADVNGIYPFYVRSDNIERSTRYIFDGEAILIPGEGRLGEIYHYINGKFDYHQRVYKISGFHKSKTDGKFILYSMQNNFKQHALQFTAKATVDSLRLPMLTTFVLNKPNIDEQYLIGRFFTELDNLITLHQRKLEKLQELKKAYLNELFV